MTVLTSGAAPCIECGTEGGFVPHDCKIPTRTKGLCRNCYNQRLLAAQQAGESTPDLWHAPQPEPWPHLHDVAATGAMLWRGKRGKRKPHAIFGYHFDARAEVAEAEHDAARWLMNHVHAPLLEWPDPSLALFGAANAQADAA